MHYLCTDHQSESVLWQAFGWLPTQCTSAPHSGACGICTDSILAEVYDLCHDDLAEALS